MEQWSNGNYMNYLKIGKATELQGRDRKLYRALEIFPGFLSWLTLLGLIVLSYFTPLWVAYFIIIFDVYWLLLVLYLGVHLFISYKRLKKYSKIDWEEKCRQLDASGSEDQEAGCLSLQGVSWKEMRQLIILPTYNEGLEVVRPSIQALVDDGFPLENMIVVLAIEERAGESAQERARLIKQEFGDKFGRFLVTVHPDNIPGELKGKGANQAWAGKIVKKEIIDKEGIDYDKILVSVFDIDTVVTPGYFYRLTYKFLTVNQPYRASYQPIPVYHNNVWQAPFFTRVAAASNTFWQMMQQIRVEKLATYSSHSMTFRALADIGFWGTNMVSEDSRIFWHCFLHYNGDYRVEPLYFPVSMDVTLDRTTIQTAKSLYKQQRRWGWGVENIPYLVFNAIKKWGSMPKGKVLSRIWVQVYGFHSWATNVLIIAIVGWTPLILGGEAFNTTVISGNLPMITRNLMTLALVGLVFSAIVSTLLLPKRKKGYGIVDNITILAQWIILPLSVIIFGAIPALESQTRMMMGKYLGFWVTPKSRE
jgi:cellulose synthase/poly-beta-1,6-N-acetylglucosamine synthase-like glycosyltransferase